MKIPGILAYKGLGARTGCFSSKKCKSCHVLREDRGLSDLAKIPIRGTHRKFSVSSEPKNCGMSQSNPFEENPGETLLRPGPFCTPSKLPMSKDACLQARRGEGENRVVQRWSKVCVSQETAGVMHPSSSGAVSPLWEQCR